MAETTRTGKRVFQQKNNVQNLKMFDLSDDIDRDVWEPANSGEGDDEWDFETRPVLMYNTATGKPEKVLNNGNFEGYQLDDPNKGKPNAVVPQADTEKSDEELEREYTQGASAAYTRGYDSQLDAYKKAHQDEQDLISSLGVSQERMNAYNARREENEKARKHDALWRGLGTLIDMGIAAGHGNVYERKPREVDYDKTRQLIDAEENAEYQQMMKQRQQAQNNFDARADQAARAGGDAALKGYLKEVDAAEKERLATMNARFKADFQEKQIASAEKIAAIRKKYSSSSRSGSGGSGTNKDLVSINYNGNATKVEKAMLNDYYNMLVDVIVNTTNLTERGKVAHGLRSECMRNGWMDDKGNLTYGAANKVQAMIISGGKPYPTIFEQYVSQTVLKELNDLWNDVLASGGTSQSGRRTFSSSQGTQGGSQGGDDYVF